MAVNPLPGGKLAGAIQSGELDGAEFNNPLSDRALGLPEAAKVYCCSPTINPASASR